MKSLFKMEMKLDSAGDVDRFIAQSIVTSLPTMLARKL